MGYLRWSDFLDTVGDPFPTTGEYESRTYDAGRSVDWTRISWNEVCPAGTDASFQVAVSEDADGPWSYGSALTTAAGTTITSTTGRYAKFKVAMTSDGADTPVVNDVQITHSGTSGSRVTRWTYDDAGNITEQARVTDAGTETDTRTYNNLNQLETSSGGWTYQYDLDGNLTEKNNGTAEDCEKWEYSWNENSRLVQVKKGVYDAAPVLVNEFSVDYQYDEMGRMLRRNDGTDVTDYYWDHWNLWREATGESVTQYLVPGFGMGSFLRDDELYTFHTDGLGSIRSVTDSDGMVVARIDLDAWGENLAGSFDLVPGGLQMGFAGALGVRKDAMTGLVWMRNRWYLAEMGHFISRDPVGIQAGQNLYNYVNQKPVNRFDSSGLEPNAAFASGPDMKIFPTRDFRDLTEVYQYKVTKRELAKDFRSRLDFLGISAHHYQDGMKLYPNDGQTPHEDVAELWNKAFPRNRPRITILGGCGSDRTILQMKGLKGDPNHVVIGFNDMMNFSTVKAFSDSVLEDLDRGWNVKQSVDRALAKIESSEGHPLRLNSQVVVEGNDGLYLRRR